MFVNPILYCFTSIFLTYISSRKYLVTFLLLFSLIYILLKVDLQAPKKELTENNLSDAEMSPPSENVGMSEDEDDEELDEDKGKGS